MLCGLALAVCAAASAHSNARPPAPVPLAPQGPQAWVSVRVSGASGVSSSALVAARAELDRLIVARHDLRLGAPSGGAGRAYEIELRVSLPTASASPLHVGVQLALTDLRTGRVLTVAAGGATSSGATLTQTVLAAVRGGWPGVSQQIHP